MTIYLNTPAFFKSFIAALLLSLVACGGGSGSSSDTTPDTFTIPASIDVGLSQVVVSPTIIIRGINKASSVSIANGEYSINGGAFTTATGTIANGQSITVRLTASDKNSTTTQATLTVGGVSANFSITTLVDIIPDVFTFLAVVDAALNTEFTSNPITVTGIAAATPISIVGGEYSIDGAAYTSVSGTVSANQTVTVKTTAPGNTELTQNAELTIGGIKGVFAITTPDDIAPPAVKFTFPTPYTLSESGSVIVRGTATDDHAISRIRLYVNGDFAVEAAPLLDGGEFTNWIATVPLQASTENEIRVTAEDDQNNVTNLAVAPHLIVRQRTDYSEAFPDTDFQFDSTFGNSFALDSSNKRLLIPMQQAKIYEVSLETGKRKLFADYSAEYPEAALAVAIDPDNNDVYLSLPDVIIKTNVSNPMEFSAQGSSLIDIARSLFIHRDTNNAKLVMASPAGVARLDLSNNQISVFSDAEQGIPDTLIPQGSLLSIDFDRTRNRYLAVSSGLDQIVAIDAVTGQRSIFSSETVGSGDSYTPGDADLYPQPTGTLARLEVDVINNRALVIESYSGKIFAVDLDSAERKLISQTTVLLNSNPRQIFQGAQLDAGNNILYTYNDRLMAVLAIDLTTGQQVIVSKAANADD